MPTPHPIRERRNNEELFFEYYPQVLEWASQLTHLDRADAEDLVQDFYVQVKCIDMLLAEVDEIEPYLFKILRNLHYTRLRRKGRSPISELSIAKYDSLERGLVAADRRHLALVHADLKEICEYACQRKSSAARASIFILRFFFGYRPSEVMKVVLASRTAVDRSLQLARREAQQYLNRPHAAPSVARQEQRRPVDAGRAHSQPLFLELRRTIFSACEGPCFERSALEQRYQALSPVRFAIRELSHLVSCRTCLDRANTILGLPRLDSRSPDDTIGRDNPPGSGDSVPRLTISRGRKRSAGPKERDALDRRMQEFLEHRPAALELVVNGETRTSQRVTADVNELHLKLNAVEEPKFIEVFSEQGVRLAYLHVTEPTLYPSLEQRQRIALSDGRSLDLTLAFANDLPTIRVVYNDPLFAQVSILGDDVDDFDVGIEASEDARQLDLVREPKSAIEVPPRASISFRELRFFKLFAPRMNPLFASAIVLALASAFCLILWLRSGPGVTASAFLDRARMRDSSVALNSQPGVIFQKVRIKTPTRTSERTLYRDMQRRRRVRERNLDADDAKLRARLTGAGVDWNDPLSAVGYGEWHNRAAVQTDSVKRTGHDRLTLTTSISDGEVVSESLTVRESDFHAVEKTIELRDYGKVEIAELNYGIMPWGAVNQDWFEPLVGRAVSDVPAMHAAIHLPHMLSYLELDEAELGARVTLNQLHADTGEPIHLTRGADGIDIKGVVDTDARKQELVSHLALLPNVRSSILTVEEIGSRAPSRSTFGSDQPIQVQSIEAQPSPLEQYLREKNLPTDQLATVSHNLLDGGLKISQAEVHFSELQPRFKEANQLPPVLQDQLASLSHTYLGTIEAGLDANQRILHSLGFDNANQATASPESTDSDDDIDEQIRRYRQLCLELIINGTGQSRPAATIAEELIDTSERIRLDLASMSATVQKSFN